MNEDRRKTFTYADSISLSRSCSRINGANVRIRNFPRRLDYLICFFRRQKSVGVLWVIFFLGNYVRRTGTPVVESSIKWRNWVISCLTSVKFISQALDSISETNNEDTKPMRWSTLILNFSVGGGAIRTLGFIVGTTHVRRNEVIKENLPMEKAPLNHRP